MSQIKIGDLVRIKDTITQIWLPPAPEWMDILRNKLCGMTLKVIYVRANDRDILVLLPPEHNNGSVPFVVMYEEDLELVYESD